MFRMLLALLILSGLAGTAQAASTLDDLVFRARYSEDHGRPGDAVQYYGQALAMTDLTQFNRVAILINRGIDYLDLGRYDDAIADYNAAIKIEPTRAAAYVNRGVAYYRIRQNDKAIADYNTAIKLQPFNAQAFYNRGNAFYDMGQPDKAFADYDSAVKLDPKDALALVKRGTVYYYNMGLLEKAIADYNGAIAIDPNLASAYVARGLALDDEGQIVKAMADYDNAIRLKPDLASSYYARGNALRGRGLYAQAAQDYDNAARLNPKDPLSYFERGRSEYLQGDYQDSIADLEQTLTLAPLYNYAILWMHIARARAGQDDAQEFSINAGQVDRARWPGAIIGLYLGDTPAGKVLEMAAADPGPQRRKACEADFYVGMNFLFKKNRDEAKRLFESAAAGCPASSNEFQAARVELKRLGS